MNRHLKEYEITEEEMKRCKKVWISSEVMMTDNVEATVSAIINDIIEYGEIKKNRIDYIKKINYKKLLSIREKLNFSNSSTLII